MRERKRERERENRFTEKKIFWKNKNKKHFLCWGGFKLSIEALFYARLNRVSYWGTLIILLRQFNKTASRNQIYKGGEKNCLNRYL